MLHELATLQDEQCITLLVHDEVLDDLNLADDERQHVVAFARHSVQEQSAMWDDFRRLDAATRRSRALATAEKHELALEELLTPSQRQRLRQIALQSMGIFAFHEADVVTGIRSVGREAGCNTRHRIPRDLTGCIMRNVRWFLWAISTARLAGFQSADGRASPRRSHSAQLAKWRELTGKPFEARSFGTPGASGGSPASSTGSCATKAGIRTKSRRDDKRKSHGAIKQVPIRLPLDAENRYAS